MSALGTILRSAAFAALAAFVTVSATAQTAHADWPTEPLTLIVPTKPGGSQDRFARTMAPYLEAELGQPIKIINKGPSLVGHSLLLQQSGNGNTFMVSTPYPFQVVNVLLKRASYTMDDFAFINAQWVDFPVLYVHKDSPWKTAKELIDDIKKNPGKIKTGVVPNSVGHLLSIQLVTDLGLGKNGVRIVTYGGGGPKRAAFAGNQIDFGIEAAAGSKPIRDFLRPLAVFLDESSPTLPGVPTITEALKDYGISMQSVDYQFLSLAVSAKFKEQYPDRWKKLVEVNKKILARPDVQEALEKKEIGADWRGPEKTKTLLDTDTAFLEKNSHLLERKKKKK